MRNRPRSLVAAALAAALVFTGSIATSQAATAASGEYIDWGVKESFRNYISGSIASGTITLGDGATKNADGSYRWPASESSYSADTGLVTVKTAGSVHFEGHHGALDLTFSKLALRLDPSGDATLSGAIVSKNSAGTVVDYGTVVIAELDDERGTRVVGDGTLDWTGLPGVLSAAATPSFAGYYGAGQSLDPVGVHIAGSWPAESDGDGLTAEATPAFVQTAEVEAGVMPTYAIPDETRGTVTVIANGFPAAVTSACRAQNVGVYAECLANGTLVRYAEQSQITATVIDVATGATLKQFDVTSARTSLNSLGYYTMQAAAIEKSTGDIFARITNYGLVTIPGDATSSADVELIGLTGVPLSNFIAFDQAAHLLYVADPSAGIVSYARVDGTWTQRGLFADAVGRAPYYITVDQSNGDVYLYDDGQSSLSTRALVKVTGFRDNAPVLQSTTIPLTSEATAGAAYSGLVSDAETGTLLALVNQNSPAINELVAVRDGTVVARESLAGYSTSMSIDEQGRVYTVSKDTKRITVFDGRAIADGDIPVLVDTVAASATGFPVAAAGIGDRVFVTVSGALPTAITVANKMTVDQYRAQKTYRTAYVYDWFESATVTTQPENVAVELDGATRLADGSLANAAPKPVTFTAEATASPAASIGWQKRSSYGWTDLADGAGVSGATSRTLTVTATEASGGSEYRALFRNSATDIAGKPVEIGVVASRVATLAVTLKEPVVVPDPGTEPGAPSVPDNGGSFDGVTLTWTGSPEIQTTPPFGGSNYFSAGVSDGTAATYSAKTSDVEVLQVAADTSRATASYETRAAHTTSGGSQAVVLSGGDAEVAADGTAVIDWQGSWSVNFYGGMVPFTLSDARLSVDAAGAGSLTADVVGYAADMADLTKKTPLAAVDDVVVATFAKVKLNTQTGFTVTPDYSGVAIAVPAGQTPQNTTTAGWGSWPQSWVDYQFATGLSSYWYSSGGAADAKKAPSAFSVGFDGATPNLPEVVPTPPAEQPTAESPAATPATPVVATPALAGSLTWGVKSSFRSYIAGPIAKGAISLSGGASALGGGYSFGQTARDYDSQAGLGSASYGGAVRFTGHSGVLDLTMSDPSVQISSATSATLSVSVNGSRIAIGAIDLSSASASTATDSVAYTNAPVRLTAAGVGAFSYGSSQFYSVGTALDPVSFVIGAESVGTSTATATVAAFTATKFTPPATPPATTGITLDPSITGPLRAGQEITASADGYQPGEEGIKVVIYSDPLVVEENLVADATGRATWTGLIPIGLEPGTHTLTFQGSINTGIEFEVVAAEELTGCLVDDASLTWGFKESFRAYISGAIAHGEWTVENGATYETPEFGWSAGAGTFDSETSTGLVQFQGSIRFSGHDGLLDTTVANPQLQFVDENTAYLLLDVSGATMDAAMSGSDEVVSSTGIPFVELDLSAGGVTWNDDRTAVTAVDVPTAITPEGFAAFPNYEAGTAFDTIDFAFTTDAECGEAAPIAAVDEAETTAISSVDDGLPWWVFVAGGAVLLLVIAAIVVLIVLRRRRAAAV